MFSPSDWLSIGIFAVAAVATVLGSYVAARGGGRSGSMEGAGGGGTYDEELAEFRVHVASSFLPRIEYERQRDRRDKEMDDIRADIRGGLLSLRTDIERDIGILRDRVDLFTSKRRT